ncbi:PqqD family protein [Rummeliibacillus suwonensis]|uniref:PqqD family protein n=1 Tax=Rummeliibacillus suwonensis TaxID=1306154 RepID=UPI0028A190B7|nr:PqqD family protein [Rummeliibacillus suwonensis]
MNKYLILKERVELRKYVNNPKTMLVVFKNRLAKNLDDEDFENIRTFTLNETATEIIQLIDGTRTYDEIVSFLSKKYHEENLSIEKKLMIFLNTWNTFIKFMLLHKICLKNSKLKW